MSGTVHNAGPMVDLVQKCTRCGCVLADYRNAWVAPNEDGTVDAPGGYAEGPITVYEGNPRVTMSGAEPDAVRCGEPS
jgi:hypothetical protein